MKKETGRESGVHLHPRSTSRQTLETTVVSHPPRFSMVQESAKNGRSDKEERQLQAYNRWMTLFYVIQGGLLLWITFMAAFGSSKHPGYSEAKAFAEAERCDA